MIDPKKPVRADHRYILQLAKVTLGSKIDPHADEFDRIARVFSKLDGSWSRLFKGSTQDLTLMKRILKVAYKKGYLTRKEHWVHVTKDKPGKDA